MSLIPLDAGMNFSFHSFHSVIASRRGNVCDHALLLCCLLLGFGLNAYVAIGTSEEHPHMWVLTQGKGFSGQTFWESLTGDKFPVNSSVSLKRYHTINCVFNDKEFYVNLQLDDRVGRSALNFSDKKCWKSINRKTIELLLPWNMNLLFADPSIDGEAAEVRLEEELRELVRQYRNEHVTTYDSEIENALVMALEAYELERIYGKVIGEAEFEGVVRSLTPKDYEFKAFPFQMREISAERALDAILKSAVGKEIITTVERHEKLAVKAKVVPYPDNILAVWILIAIIAKKY